MTDPRLFAPATERNRDAILAVLRRHLPLSGLVLEVASGTGEHIAHFAASLPHLRFQPSDPVAEHRASIDAWAAGSRNIKPAIHLDTTAEWPLIEIRAVLCINMIHIAPWQATEGLFAGAAQLLEPADMVFLYGPFRRAGAHTAPSNEAFDADLRRRDPSWGVRDLEEVAALAAAHGFTEPEVGAMPANNLAVIFRRDAATL
jgi:hypothetical protein